MVEGIVWYRYRYMSTEINDAIGTSGAYATVGVQLETLRVPPPPLRSCTSHPDTDKTRKQKLQSEAHPVTWVQTENTIFNKNRNDIGKHLNLGAPPVGTVLAKQCLSRNEQRV